MYFSNMLGENGFGTFTRGNKDSIYPFINNLNDSNVFSGGVCLEGKSLVVGDESKEIMCKDIRDHEQKSDIYNKSVGCKYTYGQVSDTEENPLITVLCKGIYFYEGIRTFVKFINVGKDAILACLVYGACDFEFYDGESVPMQRCDEHELKGKRHYYTGEKLMNSLYSVDAESGYDYTYDAVHAVLVNIGMVKGELSCKYKSVKDKTYIFSTDGIENAREKARQKKEEARRKAEEHRNNLVAMQIAYNKRQEEKAKETEAQKKEDKEKRTRARSTSSGTKENVSVGAAFFLQAVANASK